MENLAKLTPAETLLLLNSKNKKKEALLKFTLLDLLLKKVLAIKKVTTQNDGIDTYNIYVVRGEQFLHYKPLPHEEVFLFPFRTSDYMKILYQQLIRMGAQNVPNDEAFFALAIKSPNLSSHFSKSVFQKLFGGHSINKNGLVLQCSLKNELAQLEKDMPSLITSNPSKALQVLNTLGANMLLLNNVNLASLIQLDPEILNELTPLQRNEKVNDTNYDYSSCSGGGCGGSSSKDSGCSNDSGCSSSGCSGCGGCGGGD